jgi:two-component system KDP operon response regulator KdpE
MMAQPAVLIVDDEAPIRRAVRHAIEREAGRILEAGTGREAIDLIAAQRPDVIVLDLGLPDLDGAAVCREIRGWSDAAIIVLSARHTDREKVELLELGADDYVTKPFSPDELRARVRVQLRRRGSRGGASPEEIRLDDVAIDLTKRSVSRAGTRVHLTPIEWDLLRALLAHRGRTMTHAQLYSAVWNQSYGDPQHHLRVHVANLRRKLERDTIHPRLIITEPGVGYRFADET